MGKRKKCSISNNPEEEEGDDLENFAEEGESGGNWHFLLFFQNVFYPFTNINTRVTLSFVNAFRFIKSNILLSGEE